MKDSIKILSPFAFTWVTLSTTEILPQKDWVVLAFWITFALGFIFCAVSAIPGMVNILDKEDEC